MKTCSKCLETKPNSSFRSNHGRCCKECSLAYNQTIRDKRKVERPLVHKANNLLSGLRWGRGAQDRMVVLLEKYLGTNCKYCGIKLELKNISLDHKIPMPHAVRKPSKARSYHATSSFSEEQIIWMNSEENLHMVCLTCNRAKGNINDTDYTLLLAFLDEHPLMKQIVIAKLKGSNFMYKR